MFLDSFPREEAQDSRAMRPAREPAAEPARSRHPWPFPVSGKDFGLPAASAKPQVAGGPGCIAAGSSFVT